MSIRFSNDWRAQGFKHGKVLSFTLLRVWACEWSIGIEFCNFVIEIEL